MVVVSGIDAGNKNSGADRKIQPCFAFISFGCPILVPAFYKHRLLDNEAKSIGSHK